MSWGAASACVIMAIRSGFLIIACAIMCRYRVASLYASLPVATLELGTLIRLVHHDGAPVRVLPGTNGFLYICSMLALAFG
jgi:hypothetical protein